MPFIRFGIICLIVILSFFSTSIFAQGKCIDLGTGIGVSNGEMAFINFFKDGGKWEPIGNNNHPWYKVYSLDTFKVVNGAYYNWDIDWSGTVNNEQWGNDWADCFITYWDMMVDQGKVRPDGYPIGFPITVYKYKPKSADPNQGIDITKPVNINQISRRIYFPTGLTQDGWVLRWKGKGRISYQGMEVTSSNVPYVNNGSSWTPDNSYAGRDYTFTSTNGGRVVNKHFWMVHGWVLNIIESDPTDPIRDIEYLYPGLEANYDAGQRFTPLFLERIRQFKSLRYMGYLNSNGIESRRTMASGHPYENTYMIALLQWNERTPDNYYQINNGNGGNYETIIDLANQTGTDPWVNIPYCAGESYTDSLVRLFMEKLNPDRTLYLEVGNELWNFANGFDGYFWHARYRVRAYPGLGDVEARGAHINKIFKQVTQTAGPRNLPRIQRVFAGFPRYYDVNNRTVQMIDPDNWDALATTWYFTLSSDNSSDNSCRDTQSQTNWRSVLYNWYLAHPNDQAGFNTTYRNCLLSEFRCGGGYRNNVDAILAKYYNKKLICYEGGNHTFYGCTNGPTGDQLSGEGPVFSGATYPDFITNNGFINAVCVADESAEMGQVFNEVIDSLQSAGVSLANHLSFSGQSSCYGVWDLIQSRDIEAPLATLLSKYAKFKVFSERITSDNCNQVNITLTPDTVGPGLAIKMDGINDYIAGSSTYIPDESSDYTLETWIKPYFLDKEQVLASFSSDGTNDRYNVIKVRADKKIIWEIGNNGIFTAKLIGPELETERWYHVAITKNGIRYTLYVNGVKVADNNYTLTPSSRNHFTIGALRRGAVCEQFFSGEIDEVRLWNTSRTIEEIRTYMCRKVHSANSSLRAYYRFDEPDYSSYGLYDHVTKTLSGQLHNITITERSRYAVSGAAIGDYSNSVYTTSWNGVSLGLAHPNGDRAAVYNITGTQPSGIQIYMIDGESHYNDMPEYYTDISNKRVIGIFMANGLNTNYDLTYLYQGNPDVLSGGGESNLRLLRRNDYSIENWTHAGARNDLVANSLTVSCKEKYRGEYTLAHRSSLNTIRPGSGTALSDNQVPTGNVMGKVQYLDLDDYTVTFWAKGWGEVFRLTSKLNANSANFTINNSSANNISCGFRYGVHWTYDVSFDVNTPIGTNTEWHHYAITKSGSKLCIYVDGMEVKSGDVTSFFHVQEMYLFNAPSWQVGNFQGGKANLTLDELSLWNIPLDQNTIRDWMCRKITAQHPNECKNLVLYFNFDENQGMVLEDKRGPSDIVLSTDDSGFKWVSSGAAIGDVSVADYESPQSITFMHPDTDYIEATRTGGISNGIHLYRVDNMPPVPDETDNTSIYSLDSSRYWGMYIVKPFNGAPVYSLINHYQKNSRINISRESELRLLSRIDNSATLWAANASIQPNTTQHTLTLTNQNRGEYILGGLSSETFIRNTPPLPPVFLPETSTINRKTICGNSSGMVYKVQHDPNVISYDWILPPELDGYSTSDSIILSANYQGTVSKDVIIGIAAVNRYGTSSETTYTITLLPPTTVSDAGPDQILIPPVISTLMDANSPTASEIATWIRTSGSGNIVEINNPKTAVNSLSSGTNRFAWNIENSACPVSTDTMRIIVAPAPTNIVLLNGDPLPVILCEGDVLTIRAVPPEDISPDNYQWTMPAGITLLNQTGTNAVIQTDNGIGGSIQVAALYSGVASLSYASRPVNINAQPGKPVFTESPSNLCLNVDANVSIDYSASYDSVEWTLPYGIYPVNYPKSTNENILIEALDVTSGYIKAKVFNNGCTNSSAIDSFRVSVGKAPSKPQLYLGDDGNQADAVCGNNNAILWVRDADTSVMYEWQWGTSADFVQYFGDNHSGAMFNVNEENTNINVRAVLDTGVCNTSEWFVFYAWPQSQGPAQVTGISITSPAGQNPINLQVGQTYTFTATGNGSNYFWNIPEGFELVDDGNMADNHNLIRVTTSAAGYLQVFPISLRGCAGSPFTLNIGTSGALLPPVYVSGNREFCQNGNLNITISAINGATGYIWTLPDGSTYTTTTNVINQVISTSMKGIMTVVASNGSTQSSELEIPITVFSTYLTSKGFLDENQQPIEELEVCNSDYRKPVYYPDNLASSYIWEIHGSAIEFNPRYEPGYENNNNYELRNRTSPVDTMMSINWVDWRCRHDGTDGGYIVVTSKNGCGGPDIRDSVRYYWSQPLNIFVPEFTESPTNACVGSKVNFEIKPIANASQYIWKLPNGLITSDATTSNPSITADVVNGTGGIVTVMAIGSTCGGSQTIEQSSTPVTISGTPVDFHFVSSPQAACPGESMIYTVNNIGASTYTWTLPEGLGSTRVDDQDGTGVTITGSWSVMDRANMINGKVRYTNNDNSAKSITFTPDLSYTGRYKVSLSYFVQWDTRNGVPVTINSADGSAIQYVNMQINPDNGIWQNLGEYYFNSGNSGSVTIGANASGGSNSIADAVKFEIVSIDDDTSITVTAKEGMGGAVCVSVSIPQCSSDYKICTDPVNLAGTLAAPVITSQETSVCEGLSYTFRASDISANTYTWFLPAGMSINGKTGTVTDLGREVSVRMDRNEATSPRIGVSGVINSCNVSSDTVYTNTISFTGVGCKLATPVFVAQPSGICSNSNATYTIASVQYAEEYEWTLPVGIRQVGTLNTGTIVTSSPSITIEPVGHATGNMGTISVRALSSAIVNSDPTISNPVIISNVPVANVNFTDISRCGTNDGSITLSGLAANTSYSVGYTVNSIISGPVTQTSNATGNIVISNLSTGTYGNVTVTSGGCSATSNLTHTIVTPSVVPITNVIYTNPSTCGGTGTIKIAIPGSPDNQSYYIDFNNNQTNNVTGVSIRDTILLTQIPVGFTQSQVAVINQNTNCPSVSNTGGTISDPTSIRIDGLDFKNPDTCGGTGIITINASGGKDSYLYSIDFENDNIPNDTGIYQSNRIILSDIPVNTNISNLALTEISSGCKVISGLSGSISTLPTIQIRQVEIVDASECKGTGKVIIITTGATQGTTYDIDLNRDGIFEHNSTVMFDTLHVTDMSINTTIQSVAIKNRITRCVNDYTVFDTIQGPSLPQVNLNDLQPLCANAGNVVLMGGTPSGGTYIFNGDTVTEISPVNLSDGNHWIYYSYTDNQNCSNKDSSVLLINPVPKASIAGEQTLCSDLSEVPYYVMGNLPNYTHNWNVYGGNFIDGPGRDSIMVTWTAQDEGRILLNLTNNITGCFDSVEYIVNLRDTVNPVYLSCPGEYHLSALGNEQGKYYIFGPPDTVYIPKVIDNCSGMNVSLTFSPNGITPLNENLFKGYRFDGAPENIIRWVATDASGNSAECVSTVYLDFEKVPPTAFSPNNDGVNDVWEIDFLMEYPECIVKVYNRWGILIYESEKGYPTKWDGKNKGRLVPVDTYYYVINLTGSGRPLKGIISVIY